MKHKPEGKVVAEVTDGVTPRVSASLRRGFGRSSRRAKILGDQVVEERNAAAPQPRLRCLGSTQE